MKLLYIPASANSSDNTLLLSLISATMNKVNELVESNNQLSKKLAERSKTDG
jgi:hypothetical protein